jgi:hypothetical protein
MLPLSLFPVNKLEKLEDAMSISFVKLDQKAEGNAIIPLTADEALVMVTPRQKIPRPKPIYSKNRPEPATNNASRL